NLLQPVISGSYTGDNLDYVLRDSYMCGVAVGPVDLSRLIHYTMITPKGFTIHKTGLPALQMFLNTRMYLYSNVYYHRTTRAIDIHLREIFGDTMRLVFPYDPRKKMEEYLTLTDWSLLETVRGWKKSRHATQAVSTEPLEEFLDLLPTRIVVFRVYAHSHDYDAELSRAAAAILNKAPSSIDTNV